MKFDQKLITFPSGLRLIFVKTPGYYTAGFKLVVEVGSEDEKAPNGIAHLIEHSIFKGTDKLSQEEISEHFNRLSADIDASTSSEFTAYKSTFPKRNLVPVVELVSHILRKSVFDAREMEKEKQVIIEEILMHEDNPDQLAFDKLVQTMYSDVGIGNDIAGEIKNLQRVTKKEVKEFYSSHYHASNFLVSIIGDFNEDEVVDVVKKYIDKPFFVGKPVKKAWSRESDVKPVTIKSQKDINQANILIAFRTLPYTDFKRVEVGLIGFILGGSMSSRLFKKIRNELGLCYSIYAFDMNYKNNGFLGISLGTSAVNAKTAIDAVNAEIKRVLTEGVTDEEFEIAKNLTLDKYQISNDTPSTNLSYLSYTGKLFDQEEMIDYIKSVTRDQALKVFREFVKLENEFISIVAP